MHHLPLLPVLQLTNVAVFAKPAGVAPYLRRQTPYLPKKRLKTAAPFSARSVIRVAPKTRHTGFQSVSNVNTLCVQYHDDLTSYASGRS